MTARNARMRTQVYISGVPTTIRGVNSLDFPPVTAEMADSSSFENNGYAYSTPTSKQTLARQLVPPSIERKERICPFELRYGMITVPLGPTTGCPPRPAAPSLPARDGLHVSRRWPAPPR